MDSNFRPLVSEATALPTEQQPLPSILPDEFAQIQIWTMMT